MRRVTIRFPFQKDCPKLLGGGMVRGQERKQRTSSGGKGNSTQDREGRRWPGSGKVPLRPLKAATSMLVTARGEHWHRSLMSQAELCYLVSV